MEFLAGADTAHVGQLTEAGLGGDALGGLFGGASRRRGLGFLVAPFGAILGCASRQGLGSECRRGHGIRVDGGDRHVIEGVCVHGRIWRFLEKRGSPSPRRGGVVEEWREKAARVVDDGVEGVASHEAAQVFPEHEGALVPMPGVQAEGSVEDLVEAGHQLLDPQELGGDLGPANTVDGLKIALRAEQGLEREELVEQCA